MTTRRGFLTRIAAAVAAAPVLAVTETRPAETVDAAPGLTEAQRIEALAKAYLDTPEGRAEQMQWIARYRGEDESFSGYQRLMEMHDAGLATWDELMEARGGATLGDISTDALTIDYDTVLAGPFPVTGNATFNGSIPADPGYVITLRNATGRPMFGIPARKD